MFIEMFAKLGWFCCVIEDETGEIKFQLRFFNWAIWCRGLVRDTETCLMKIPIFPLPKSVTYRQILFIA